MITSTLNGRVKEVAALVKKSKYRNEEGLFVVEGPKMFEETPRDRIRRVYMTERFQSEIRENGKGFLLDGLNRAETVSEEVMRAMSDTQTPQGVLALVQQYRYTLADLLAADGPAHLVILETMQDPGNLGTIIRAGEGAGVTGVIMDARTADIYSPKVIRSTMGSIFRVPFCRTGDLEGTLRTLKRAGVRLAAADPRQSRDYDREDYTGPVGFLIGNEAAGLSAGAAALADTRVKIPMRGKVESLNAAVAASVLMFEAARQRRRGS